MQTVFDTFFEQQDKDSKQRVTDISMYVVNEIDTGQDVAEIKGDALKRFVLHCIVSYIEEYDASITLFELRQVICLLAQKYSNLTLTS